MIPVCLQLKSLAVIDKLRIETTFRLGRKRASLIKKYGACNEEEKELAQREIKVSKTAVSIVKTAQQPPPPPATAESYYVGFGYRFPMTAYLLSI